MAKHKKTERRKEIDRRRHRKEERKKELAKKARLERPASKKSETTH